MQYLDAFVLPVPKKNLQAHRRIAQKAGKIWRSTALLNIGNASPGISRKRSPRSLMAW